MDIPKNWIWREARKGWVWVKEEYISGHEVERLCGREYWTPFSPGDFDFMLAELESGEIDFEEIAREGKIYEIGRKQDFDNKRAARPVRSTELIREILKDYSRKS